MFTGLVQCVGAISKLTPMAQGSRISIKSTLSEPDRALGASISVSGVCLTVTAASGDEFEAVAAFETLRATKIGKMSVGMHVNLEAALRVGDALGGHFVSGHVDGLGQLRKVTARGDAREMWFDAPEQLMPYLAEKGSICIDGVSLTVNAIDAKGFAVGIIPHTLEVTTLGELQVGSAVHLEADVIARYVARIMQCGGTVRGLSKKTLEDAGFMIPDREGYEQ